MPGLSFKTACIWADNVQTGESNNGKEHEFFKQVKCTVQNGPAKDLSIRLRNSFLRVSNNASDYNSGGNETRIFVDYPINVF